MISPKPDSIENLKSWINSTEAEKWVDAHGGVWNHEDWLNLLKQLKDGPYWPISSEGVGTHLESIARKYRYKKERILADSDQASLHPALRRYIGGLATVGVLSGFFAGSSHTPIVGTLLPLLFALIGGTSGIYLVTADLDSPSLASRLRWLGYALGFFGLACLLGTLVGISLRLNYEDPQRDELMTMWDGNKVQAAVQLATLRAKLELLGLSAKERAKVMAVAGTALDNEGLPIDAKRLGEVVAQASTVLSELKALRDKSVTVNPVAPTVAPTVVPTVTPTVTPTVVPADVVNLISQLEYFCHQTEPWLKSGMPRDLYRINVVRLWSYLRNPPSDNKMDAFFDKASFDTQNLGKLFLLLDEFQRQDDLNWEPAGTTSDNLDRFPQEPIKPPENHNWIPIK